MPGRFDRYSLETDPHVIQDLHRRLHNTIRIGTISEVDAKKGRARVTVGELKTTWIKWHAGRSGDDSNWNPPSPGEQVTLLSPSGRLENATILPGLFSKTEDSPSNDQDHRHYSSKDGSQVFHDVKNKVKQTSMPAQGSSTHFVGDSTSYAHLDGEHVFKMGNDAIVSFHKDYVHLHHSDSGIKIEKGKVTIQTPMFIAPTPTPGGMHDGAPADNTPKNSIPTNGGSSTSSAPGNDTGGSSS